MVDLTRHQILQDIYNLSSAVEDIGVDRRLSNISNQAMGILRKADSLVTENAQLKAQIAELQKAREPA